MSAVSAAPVLHTALQPLTFVRYEALCKLQVGVVYGRGRSGLNGSGLGTVTHTCEPRIKLHSYIK